MNSNAHSKLDDLIGCFLKIHIESLCPLLCCPWFLQGFLPRRKVDWTWEHRGGHQETRHQTEGKPLLPQWFQKEGRYRLRNRLKILEVKMIMQVSVHEIGLDWSLASSHIYMKEFHRSPRYPLWLGFVGDSQRIQILRSHWKASK